MTQNLEIPFPQKPAGISLLDFNRRIKALLHNDTLLEQWVVAETSDVRLSRGHCYMELIQKDDAGATIARLQAVVWASTFQSLNYKFLNATGNHLGSNMKVMVRLSATYHELYGMKAVITDVDPSYTLGDMERIRLEILQRLKAEGVLEMNKQLPWPQAVQRVAVISAPGAAGYGDFMHQLEGNSYGLVFYTCLFAATMQGASTAPSVIDALNRIERHAHLFDCVVIIRGGGSTSDLNSFDNYDLANNIAQFPLPVITGIGHERDVTVLDYVAALRVKTPTAAAEFLIGRGVEQLARLQELQNTVASLVQESLARAGEQLAYYTSFIPLAATRIVETGKMRLQQQAQALPLAVTNRIAAERARLDRSVQLIAAALPQQLSREKMRLDNLQDKVAILSPRNTLNRGYSLTMHNGHVVTDASQLKPGDVVTTHFKAGSVKSTIVTSQKS